MRRVPCTVLLLLCGLACGDAAVRDYTCFQTAGQWSPAVDAGSDVAVVYGVNGSFADRVALWREKGYTASMMTGIAWGGYGDYYMTPEGFRKDEVQTDKNGKLFMHGNSTTVGYNVPSPDYVEYIKRNITPAIELGVRAVYLEEPEYWAQTGWSEGFKKEWQRRYGEPWQPPDSSVDAQYRASLLKYELYFDALREVFRYVKEEGAKRGFDIECHVPTHSLVNYAQWRIVSPESHLMDLEEMDGYIAQVWTGTARSHNVYRGEPKERTFEGAFLEYSQALGMVRPTGRKVWFLADPVEDNPDRSWADYKRNYECTVAASLLFPEVARFEVMPWPDRIFQGKYASVDLDIKGGARAGIPADYATELLTVINALNDMDQAEADYFGAARGIGVLVSDTMMFQRAAPTPSDSYLSSFFGLAMPLVKHGVPVEVVQLENTLQPKVFDGLRVLLLTYEGQKPLKPEYHAAIAAWVRGGGCLLFVEDGSDPYHAVRAWWNEDGATEAKAFDSLFARLGVERGDAAGPVAAGSGWVQAIAASPRKLARAADGADKVIGWVRGLLGKRGEALEVRNYLGVQRGPYRIYGVMDESVSDAPLRVEGRFVDLFDPMLACVTARDIRPNERAFLCDLDWLRAHGATAKVIACAARVRGERIEGNTLRFTARGPEATTARARILLPNAPKAVRTTPEIPVTTEWNADSGTALPIFPNSARDIAFEIEF